MPAKPSTRPNLSQLKFFNTLTRKLEVFTPIQSGPAATVRLYTCGPTIYNFAHIGNFRAYLFEDLLRRYLKFRGYKVKQVMNLTDVDDKTIRDSMKEGLALRTFTDKYAKAFFDDIKELNIEPAEVYPRATDHIQEMILLIKTLLDKGLAYKSEDGCVYFSIRKFKEYGKLSNMVLEEVQEGASGRIIKDEYEKDQAADFALWKAWDKNDGDVAWDSPFGKGRPGWHIECSAMSMKHLTETFSDGFHPDRFETIDIHTGGFDNMFPHHEDEIAQSEGVTGKQFVKYWMHNGWLLVDNKKMSKSLNNFYTLRDLKGKGVDLRVFRYMCLSVHYRQKFNFSFDSLAASKESLKAIDDFLLNLGAAKSAAHSEKIHSLMERFESEFTQALDDDLNASPAVASIFNFMREVNKIHAELSKDDADSIRSLFKRIDSVLGVMKFEQDEAPKDLMDLANQRQEARKRKDWAESDRLRDLIASKGWAVEDLASGPRLKKIS